MECFAPIRIRNPNGEGSIRVPCGKCEACVANKSAQWYARLAMQLKFSRNAVFVTLTYDDRNVPSDFNVSPDDIRLYHYRLRKSLGEKSKQFKYFLVSEYGPNPSIDENGRVRPNRPHYHAIYFNLDNCDYDKVTEAWNKGFVTFGEITDGRLRYVSGYCIEKLFVPFGHKKNFTRISKGIGLDFVSKIGNRFTTIERIYVPVNGKKLPMSRYYKDRILSLEEKQEFAELCKARAEERYKADVFRLGSEEAVQDLYTSDRQNFVRKFRNKHKHKKN